MSASKVTTRLMTGAVAGALVTGLLAIAPSSGAVVRVGAVGAASTFGQTQFTRPSRRAR